MRTIMLLLAAMLAFAGCTEDTDPTITDSDGDGFTDAEETEAGTDPEDPEDAPVEEDETPDIETEFTFGPGAGCAGDVLQTGGVNCAAFLAGPETGGPDGFWVPLTEDYEGVSFEVTAQNQLGDTDCFAVDSDGAAMSSDLNNADGPCGGTVPSGAAYLFIYSYAEAHTGMTATFTP